MADLAEKLAATVGKFPAPSLLAVIAELKREAKMRVRVYLNLIDRGKLTEDQAPSLAAKVGSILVHVEEGLSEDRHHFDWEAVKVLLAQSDVTAWIASLQKIALVPVKRRRRP